MAQQETQPLAICLFSSRNCQLPTIKIESKNYERGLVIVVVYLKPKTNSSELSKSFEEYFEANDTQAKTDGFNVWRINY